MNPPTQYSSLAPFRKFFLTGRPILMYHNVGPRPQGVRIKGLYVNLWRFKRQMAELAAAGFSTPEFAAFAVQRGVFLTFDDGFRNVFDNALPVLQRHKFRAIEFLLPNLIGKTNEWMEREGDVTEPLMDKAQVRDWLAAGQQIGSHTLNHPHLPRLPENEAREEISASKKKLEDLFGIPIEHFCYPYGDWNERVRDLVAAAGYRTACTTDFGVNDPGTPPFELKRITARYPSCSWKAFRAWLSRSWQSLRQAT